MTLDESGSEATDVRPGRYKIRATDANNDRADVVIDVEPVFANAVVIDRYVVRPATTTFSRDGQVEAIGSGFENGCKFMWTNGLETEEPRLKDVACGVYAMIAISQGTAKPPPITIHRSAPARVDVG